MPSPYRPMDLKSQDLQVLLKVAAHPPQRWAYVALGEALTLSASQAHASVKRAVASGLAVASVRGEWSPERQNQLEFVLHGVRYAWPATAGPLKRGVPTAFGTEPLASKLTAPPASSPAGLPVTPRHTICLRITADQILPCTSPS